jgi:iron complex outermembrane receptor protein
VISTFLEAEQGWNYELMLRKMALRNKLRLELTGFYFALNDALVQRRDASGGDFFINSGLVRQKGLEAAVDYYCRPAIRRATDHFNLQAAYSLNHFRYGSFIKGTEDFSGKTIPSVPSNTFSVLADLVFRNGLYSNATYYASSSIFLNDANTVSAPAYHLLGFRAGWKKIIQKKIKLNFYTGVQNLLDEKYSLGNDINAAGGRYYNAAPRRNYYAGISFQWMRLPDQLPF